LLQQNLDEEKATERKLTAIAEARLNRPAALGKTIGTATETQR
jgi:hypothetical protein